MKYEYREEWYRGVENLSPVKRPENEKDGKDGESKASRKSSPSAKAAVRALASVLLCAAASYAGAAVIGTGLAADDIGAPAKTPDENGDSAFVMSWSWEGGAAPSETDDNAAHEERIRELAEAYIAEKTGKGSGE